MRRQLRTSSRSVREQVQHVPMEQTRRAFLVTPYRDKMTAVVVTLSDPRMGTRGTTLRARIAAGTPGLSTAAPSLDAGWPVTVVVRRGILTVVGF